MNIPEGFIPLPPRVEPQTAFHPLLDDLHRTLTRLPSERALHSVYLCNNVARDEANTRRSGLDLTLALHNPPNPKLAAQLETARLALQARHSEVSRIDFDIGHLGRARDPANRDSWGHWFKHRCRCLWGKDLASALPPLCPAKAIVLVPSGDYAQALEDYVRRLESASSGEKYHRLQQEAAKKLARSGDILRGKTEDAWPETLEYYLALSRAQHPRQMPILEYSKAVLDGQVTDPTVSIERLRAFSAWI